MTPEQSEVLYLKENQRLTRKEIAERLGISERCVKERLVRARNNRSKEQNQRKGAMDSGVVSYLESKGFDNFSAIADGWIIHRDEDGNGHSIRFKTPGGTTVDLAEAMRDVFAEVQPLAPITAPKMSGKDLCNFLPLADLHCGGEYANPEYEQKLYNLIDRIVSRLPEAEKAVIVELGDLLDANDHKGVTPASGNHCDVIRDDHFGQLKMAQRVMLYAIRRLAETHSQVEVHMMRGNHDETSFMAVLMALSAWFKDVGHVNIVESVADYRVISWGECAIFPNHGDVAKWDALRDVWITDFADEWAAAKAVRLIWTAHFHSLKSEEKAGVTCVGHRSTAKGNRYVHLNGWRSKRGICAVTLHKTEGEVDYTPSFIRK